MRRFLGLVLYPKIRNHEDIENLIKRNAYLKGYEFMRFFFLQYKKLVINCSYGSYRNTHSLQFMP